MKKVLLLAVIFVLIVSISATSIYAQSQSEIPAWVKGVASFWVDGNISDSDFGESITFLIEQNIIQVEMPESDDYQTTKKIRDLTVENKKLKAENKKLKQENANLNDLVNDLIGTNTDSYPDYSDYLDNGCHVSTPYLWSDGLCHTISEPTCPAGYPYFWSDGFCYTEPEFYDNGCPNGYPYFWSDGLCHTISEYSYDKPADTTTSCDESYPDVCIAPYPPDLDCDEIIYSNFRVIGSDPHGFDRDNDGIGCES